MPAEFSGLDSFFEDSIKNHSIAKADKTKIRWIEEPAPFRKFLTDRDHMNFPDYSERQMMIPEYLFGDDPKNIFDNDKYMAVVEAGKGCLTKESLLENIFTGKKYSIEELIRKNKKIPIQCYDEFEGIPTSEKASIPWKSGTGSIYRVKTELNKTIDVYKKHKFLCKNRRWVCLYELKIGDEILDDNPLENILCKCGCGQKVSKNREWLRGHCARVNKPNYWKDKHLSNEHKDKITESLNGKFVGRIVNWGDKISKTRKEKFASGELKNWTEGKTKYNDPRIAKMAIKQKINGEVFSKEFKEKMLLMTEEERSLKYGHQKDEHPLFGKHHSIQANINNSNAQLCKGKTLEEYYGAEKADAIKRSSVNSLHKQKFQTQIKYINWKGQSCNLKSKLELRMSKILDKLKLDWEGVSESFLYPYKNKEHRYYPDFRIKYQDSVLYLEVKGWNPHLKFKRVRAKLRAVKNAKKEILLITEKDIKRMEDKVFRTELKWVKIESIEYLREDDYYDLEVPKYHNYLAHGLYNHNSGKDTISAHCINYVIHILECAENVRLQFPGIGPTDPIDGVNVAYNDQQSKIVFFEKFKTNIINWKWLKRRYNFKISGKLLNPSDKLLAEEKVIINQNSIFFPNNIRVFSMNSQQEGWEGLNPLFWVLDEFCFDASQKVSLKNGKYERIGNLVNKKMNVEVLSKNKNGKLKYKKITNWFKYPLKQKEMLKIKVGFLGKNYKKKIVCTKNHWIYSENGKIQAGNLKLGDNLQVRGTFLSDFQKSFIYGSLLGDAHFNLRESRHKSNSCQLFFNHGEPQKDYLFLKHKILENFAHNIGRSNSGYRKENSNYCFECNKIEGMQEILENCTINRKKKVNKKWIDKLDLIALTFWYLDDGNLHKRMESFGYSYNSQFSTQSFDKEEVLLLINKLNSYGYDAKIRVWGNRKCDGKEAYKIILTVEGTKKFIKDISQYIPKCMSYKSFLPCKNDNFYDIGEIPEVGLMPVQEISTFKKGRSFVYDIEVEDNHNYFAGDILVSNSAFLGKDKLRNSEKILNVAETSARSRFGNKYKGFVISYPRFKDDPIQKLRKQYEGSLNVYTDRATTFEMKPKRCFSGKWYDYKGHKVPLEFKERFDKKPEDSETKFLCLPQHADDPFFKEPSRIDACTDARASIIQTEDYTFSNGEKNYICKRIKNVNFGVTQNRFLIILDLGISGDPSAAAVWHRERYHLPDCSYEDHYYQDYIGLWHPDESKKLIVNLDNVEQFAKDLCIKYKLPVELVSVDRWNSGNMMQHFSAAGMPNEHYNLTSQDYDDARTKLYSGSVHLLNYEPQLTELKRLVNTGKGGADHPIDEHNDMSQTTFAALKLLSGINENGNGKGMKMAENDGQIITENIGNDGVIIGDMNSNLGEGFSFHH